MIIPQHTYISDVPKKLVELFQIIPWNIWKKRSDDLLQHMPNNSLWNSFIKERYGIELALPNIKNYISVTRHAPWPPRTIYEHHVVALCGMIPEIYKQLPIHSQNRFKGQLLSCFESEHGIKPFHCEINIAGQLMSRNIDVHFHDLDVGSGFDFLCSLGDLKFEVECKYISIDKGQKIHRRHIYQFMGRLAPFIEQFTSVSNECAHVKVLIPDRFPLNNNEQDLLSDLIKRSINLKSNIDENDYKIFYENFDMKGSIFESFSLNDISDDEIRDKYFEKNDGGENFIFPFIITGKCAILISFKSNRPDTLLSTIFREMKDSIKKQFSGNLPAVLIIKLGDITNRDLNYICKSDVPEKRTGLAKIASHLTEYRPYIHSIVFMSDPILDECINQCDVKDNYEFYREANFTYLFKNPNHPLFEDHRLKLFEG